MTDVQLLRAARTAAAPFRELYGRYAERIYSFHLRRTGNTDAAHDLTAETFARAHGSGGRASATTLKARPRRGCTGSRATCCSNRSGVESSSATRAGGLGIAADLGRLGDALEAAAHDQLARRRWSRLLRSRRSVIAIAVAGIVIPAAAVGAARLIGGH